MIDTAYKNLVNEILEDGIWRENRTGVDALTIPHYHIQHDMSKGFPLLTTKKMSLRTIAVELEGFLNGITDKAWYKERKCNIWSEWSSSLGCPSWFSDKEKKEHQLKDNDLGPIYGYQWRSFNKPYKISNPQNIDNIKPTVVDVGVILGTSKFNLGLKSTWYGMINRCYNKNDKDYPNYGAKGVYVVNRWLTYEYFEEDAMRLPGWGNKKEDNSEYTLDKDKSGLKCYGPNTCSWLSRKEQACFRSDIKPIIALSPKNENLWYRSIKECAEKNNLDTTGISHCISGRQQSHNGWQFWREKENKEDDCFDQLLSIIKTIEKNPNDRRLICSAWNPNQIHIMALPPCHMSWKVNVLGDKLHLSWNQRSVDTCLGLPYNIASYALLQMLLCKQFGYKPGKLSGFLDDVHIYRNHVDKIKEQIEREPKALCSVDIAHNKPFSFQNGVLNVDWTHKDIAVFDYESHEAVQYEVAI